MRGYGSASRWMYGEIHALFYRHKARGGSEYVSDFFIGPRTPHKAEPKQPHFVTRHGDSGTLWLLEPEPDDRRKKFPVGCTDSAIASKGFRPLALQWGANSLYSGKDTQPYALATALSTICERLDVDLLRDWNLDQDETWGAVGHFSIASRVSGALSRSVPTLAKLMKNNALIVSHNDATILKSRFKNMGEDAFIPMADIPDFFWKHGKQGHTRGVEGPNHFADMDQKRPGDGLDLLTMCKNPKNIDPDAWNDFYGTIKDLLTGRDITQNHRGLLPFRVWQIFDCMVEFVQNNQIPKFVCAAGVLTHYVGDACQPLHISYLHDGDPLQATIHVVKHRDGTEEEKRIPLGQGLHAAYEDDMVNANRDKILKGLSKTPKVTKKDLVANGYEAAVKTIELMRSTFKRLQPQDLLDTYLATDKDENAAEALWRRFGTKTIAAMQGGTHLLAVLWESAWVAGGGEGAKRSTKVLSEDQAMAICAQKTFLPSCAINQIGQFLEKPATVAASQTASGRRPAKGGLQAPRVAAAPAR
ncbi:hypothetical protein [Methyloceanibacter sp.]|uniref:hypothetical protein n=1 Tax=Methyloceanibacter sp. TaxID=1965321 RepID=UPI003D6D7250